MNKREYTLNVYEVVENELIITVLIGTDKASKRLKELKNCWENKMFNEFRQKVYQDYYEILEEYLSEKNVQNALKATSISTIRFSYEVGKRVLDAIDEAETTTLYSQLIKQYPNLSTYDFSEIVTLTQIANNYLTQLSYEATKMRLLDQIKDSMVLKIQDDFKKLLKEKNLANFYLGLYKIYDYISLQIKDNESFINSTIFSNSTSKSDKSLFWIIKVRIIIEKILLYKETYLQHLENKSKEKIQTNTIFINKSATILEELKNIHNHK